MSAQAGCRLVPDRLSTGIRSGHLALARGRPARFIAAMRFQIFLAGFAVLALAYAGAEALFGDERLGFIIDALKLGGALLICGLFSLRMPLHGMLGAAVVALIGALYGAQHLAVIPRFWFGERRPDPVALLSSAAALICVLLVVGVVRFLFAEKRRKSLEDAADDADQSDSTT